MIEKVMPGIYRVPVPLLDNPLQATNAYIIKGRERHLVVDTGMDRPECEDALLGAFAELGMEPGQMDFFITHIHVDHLDLVFKLASPVSRIFFSRPDGETLRDHDSWDSSVDLAARNGFPRSELQKLVQGFRNTVFSYSRDVEFTFVGEGDKINVGDYEFTFLETPGHTPGCMCLYEREEKILFSGDHILDEITPNISLLMEREINPLLSYLESLEKIFTLDLERIFPGHRGVIEDPKKRIRELFEHHKRREEEVLAILAEGPAHAYDVASRMSWDIPLGNWIEFPTFQRWFATGEALAHLKYLESRELVCLMEKGEKVLWTQTSCGI